jgi:hypothetical protein
MLKMHADDADFWAESPNSNSVGQRPTKTETPPTARPEGAKAKKKNGLINDEN